MAEKDWREHAHVLFFVEKKSVVSISKEVNVSRQHVSKYLKTCGEYEREKERRKAFNKEKRKKSKWEWNRKYRGIDYSVDADTMRREHFEAVGVLSYEKFY